MVFAKRTLVFLSSLVLFAVRGAKVNVRIQDVLGTPGNLSSVKVLNYDQPNPSLKDDSKGSFSSVGNKNLQSYVWIYDTQTREMKLNVTDEKKPCLTVPYDEKYVRYVDDFFTVKECYSDSGKPQSYMGTHIKAMIPGDEKFNFTISKKSQQFTLGQVYDPEQKDKKVAIGINLINDGNNLKLRVPPPTPSADFRMWVDDGKENTLLLMMRDCVKDGDQWYPCAGKAYATEEQPCDSKEDMFGMHVHNILDEKKCKCDDRGDAVTTCGCEGGPIPLTIKCSACQKGFSGDGEKCSPCTKGKTFANHDDMEKCLTCRTNCTAGSAIQAPTTCNTTSDTLCEKCQEKTYSEDGIKCLPCSPGCAIGKGFQSECTREKDTNCVDCTPGKTFNNITNTKDSCKLCKHCSDELVVHDICTTATDTVCGICKRGTWHKPKDNRCIPCTVCPNGQRVKSACGLEVDTVCTTEACPSGEFINANKQNNCEKCSECAPGKGATKACSRNADTQCTVCTDHMFSTTTSLVDQCQNCKVCGTGQATTVACDKTHDAQCLTCELGKTWANGNQCSACKSCKHTYKDCSTISDTLCADGKGHTVQVILITFICIIVSIIFAIGFRSYTTYYYAKMNSAVPSFSRG